MAVVAINVATLEVPTPVSALLDINLTRQRKPARKVSLVRVYKISFPLYQMSEHFSAIWHLLLVNGRFLK